MAKYSNRQDGYPAFLFYPNDWLASPDLNSCSLEAQGLWIKMLCIMYLSPKRGVLLLSSGKQIESKTLAKMCGIDEQTISKLLKELEEAGVFSRLDNQAIYNRRMYREGQISEARREAGRLGGKKQNKSKDGSKTEASVENEYYINIENKNNKEKEGDCKEEGKEKIDKKQVEEFFERVWQAYPKRKGKKVGKKECWEFVKEKIKPTEWDDLLKATENYAKSDESVEGYARDPIRFLKKEYWRDWVDVELSGKIKFNEDKEFICADCKQIKQKSEREYGEDGSARCRSCHQKYIENWKKEKEMDIQKAKEEWQRLSPEQKEKRKELFRKLNIPIPAWMGGG